MLKCRLVNLKERDSPAGLHFFSLPLSPAETSTLTSALYLFPIRAQPHIPSKDGCLFNLKPLMESAYCLWSTYSWWVNISHLRPFSFFFHRCPSLKKVLAGLAKSLKVQSVRYGHGFSLKLNELKVSTECEETAVLTLYIVVYVLCCRDIY